MFERYLSALQYPRIGQINFEDPKDFRGFIAWLEDQKIRLYPIEERDALRKINALEWSKVYKKYKQDIHMPAPLKTQREELAWLLLYAIKLEYSDEASQYKTITAAKKQDGEAKRTAAPQIKSTSLFDAFDQSDADFVEGSYKLAERLGIAHHPTHLISLQAAAKVICTSFDKEALKERVVTGKPFPIDEGNGMGFTDDGALEQGARILRLLQIQSVRKLQTTINETIVSAQNITADPRTDTKLGVVGIKQ
ncbi:RNA transcription, translation and transport factor protein [Anopheles bellator]|uniref:RNA transcription, translation and transport factor protein n=1 Tax=Anopheles bellator TaxID=139047 RepID=UPI002647F947|nr:RNA transcription, translation and transport factor protein [Anopheles bellator]